VVSCRPVLLTKKPPEVSDPCAKRLGSLEAAFQIGIAVADCTSLASSKRTVCLGHSLKSCKSACPYLVQCAEAFKGNGEGQRLQRRQSLALHSETSHYINQSVIFMRLVPDYFIIKGSDGYVKLK